MLVRSFLSAGVDTTIGGIANLLLTLARHPAEYAKLHAEPDLHDRRFEKACATNRWFRQFSVRPRGDGNCRRDDPGRPEGAQPARARTGILASGPTPIGST
jgi:cytochrome P450